MLRGVGDELAEVGEAVVIHVGVDVDGERCVGEAGEGGVDLFIESFPDVQGNGVRSVLADEHGLWGDIGEFEVGFALCSLGFAEKGFVCFVHVFFVCCCGDEFDVGACAFVERGDKGVEVFGSLGVVEVETEACVAPGFVHLRS